MEKGEKSEDVSDLVNEIIDQLRPVYVNSEDEGEHGVLRFIAALFASVTKLCVELQLDKEDAVALFDRMWELTESNNNKTLN